MPVPGRQSKGNGQAEGSITSFVPFLQQLQTTIMTMMMTMSFLCNNNNNGKNFQNIFLWMSCHVNFNLTCQPSSLALIPTKKGFSLWPASGPHGISRNYLVICCWCYCLLCFPPPPKKSLMTLLSSVFYGQKSFFGGQTTTGVICGKKVMVAMLVGKRWEWEWLAFCANQKSKFSQITLFNVFN